MLSPIAAHAVLFRLVNIEKNFCGPGGEVGSIGSTTRCDSAWVSFNILRIRCEWHEANNHWTVNVQLFIERWATISTGFDPDLMTAGLTAIENARQFFDSRRALLDSP